ncbi:MAG: helix-turn-helix transcriptional regulator [Lachnoclostridium edouardi]|uniref:PadR family transcriptional regulator n=1 Tax=Lachnoclostridium edouardi TaxID=1926283 RepID=UPI0026DCBD21|nr:helix-turn-helix transcriptional regulator [Lachnoclostridium edouardi]MDO4277608.1 helix-turn-helix transcriptional regulator [Lachnoclostridium edouardi]
MAREQYQSLTEQMYYILLSLLSPRCGSEITEKVLEISHERICLKPGTLYALLNTFEKDGIIQEVKIEGRKKYYTLTSVGNHMLREEYNRLQLLVLEGSAYLS